MMKERKKEKKEEQQRQRSAPIGPWFASHQGQKGLSGDCIDLVQLNLGGQDEKMGVQEEGWN